MSFVWKLYIPTTQSTLHGFQCIPSASSVHVFRKAEQFFDLLDYEGHISKTVSMVNNPAFVSVVSGQKETAESMIG